MSYYNKMLILNKIYDALQDDESRKIFDARINYLVDRNKDEYLNITDSKEKWYCSYIEDWKKKNGNPKGIIIYGVGHDGLRTKEVLQRCGYEIGFFCDQKCDRISLVDNIKVISRDELKSKDNYLIVIASSKYMQEIYKGLMDCGVDKKYIIMPELEGIVSAFWGNQYFDVFSAEQDEVFIDGGAYDGYTAEEFIKWCGGKYKKIYELEPLEEQYRMIQKKFQNNDRVKVVNGALWNKAEYIYFNQNSRASSVSDIGEIKVNGIKIDDLCKEERVTFIKMDIEGSEMQALEGAEEVIKRDKPKLAICLYHKEGDIIDLSLKVLDFVPEYKLYIRHYTSTLGETVLYAQV